MKRHWLAVSIWCFCLGSLLLGCSILDDAGDNPAPAVDTQTPPPTPSVQALRRIGASGPGPRLRVTLKSLELLKRTSEDDAQLFLVMADPGGNYTYLLYPANRAGAVTDKFDLAQFPLELTVDDPTSAVTFWILAVHNTRYYGAEVLGLEALVSSLAIGFRHWLAEGDPQDDPLAAVISASDGALYEWFAGIEVVGQGMVTLMAEDNWRVGTGSLLSPDDGLRAIYSVEYLSAEDVALLPSPTPTPEFPGYTLLLDETFPGGTSTYPWYENQDSTYMNVITDGAYEIRLTDIVNRESGVSWGSIEDVYFKDYIVEAKVRLIEDDVQDGRYGIWFHYQDDRNFMYFGITNEGEYRVALVENNVNKIEMQPWTRHPAINPGAATNTLTIETGTDGTVAVGINGEHLTSFTNQTFTSGSVAFFCYAKSTPTTCRLERIRIWERAE